jgi:hypothetical protein
MNSNLEPKTPMTGVEEESDETPYAAVAERKVVIQPYDYPVRTLMDLIVDGDLRLDPDYQRQYRWEDDKASRFIESVILNIPVPVLYLAEESDSSFSVIDGQQRLTSLMRFIKPLELSSIFPQADLQELVLAGLKVRPDLNGKRYSELERSDRSAIAKRPIRCIVVLNESDSTLKFEVFERLNTGSASLTDQEVRNCIYRGTYNTLIKELATNKRFVEMATLPDSDRNSMKHAELVLRFLAYEALTEKTEYSGNLSEYLNTHMELNREISAQRKGDLESLFERTIDTLYEALGPAVAFRKPSDRSNPVAAAYAQNLINGAIFESQMIAAFRLVSSGRALPANVVKTRLLEAFKIDDYWNCLFQGTAQRSKALRRGDILTRHLMA